MKKNLVTIILISIIIIWASLLVYIIWQRDKVNLSDDELYYYNQNYDHDDYSRKFLDKGIRKIAEKVNIDVVDESADSPEEAKDIVLEANNEIHDDKITKDLKVEYENKYAYVVTYILQWEDFGNIKEKESADIVFKKEYFDAEEEIIYTKNKKDIYNILNLYCWTWNRWFANVQMINSDIYKTKKGYIYSYYYINEIDDHEHIWSGPIDYIKEIHELRYCKIDICIVPGEPIDMEGEYYQLKVLDSRRK